MNNPLGRKKGNYTLYHRVGQSLQVFANRVTLQMEPNGTYFYGGNMVFLRELFSSKNREKLPVAPAPEPILDDQAKVFVWSGDADNVGHVSIQLEAKKDGSKTYTSIWPKRVPAVGPLTIFPLRAALATRLEQDIKSESNGFSLQLDNGSESLVPRSSGQQINPDKIFTVPIPDMDAMRKEYDRIESGVKEGNICYQLFPNVKTTSREVYDCSTLVAQLLKVGGVTGLPATPEWKPSVFAEILEQQPHVTSL